MACLNKEGKPETLFTTAKKKRTLDAEPASGNVMGLSAHNPFPLEVRSSFTLQFSPLTD